VPDLEVVTIKIHINMKKEQNLQEPQKQALNIPVVSKSVCLLIDTTCGYRTWNGKCNCEDDKCRQKQTVC